MTVGLIPKGIALEAMRFQPFRSEIRKRGGDWPKPLPRGRSFDHFVVLVWRTLKLLYKTPGQESAVFGWTAGNRLLAPFARSKLPSDRGFDQKRPFFRIQLPSDEGFDHFRRAQGPRPRGFDQKRPFFRIWLPSDEGSDHSRRAQGPRPEVLAF